MTKILVSSVCATLFTLGAATSALAHGDVKCPAVPKAEWRPAAELEAKLKADGWAIRRMETTPTCYEVYAKDPQGKRIEAFFNPKTLERVELSR
jgi:hypothetical protein